eukprot:scaffold365638_cov35-Attheya_sp.AAC.4
MKRLEWQPPIHTLQLILAELYISKETNSEAQDWEDLNPRQADHHSRMAVSNLMALPQGTKPEDLYIPAMPARVQRC